MPRITLLWLAAISLAAACTPEGSFTTAPTETPSAAIASACPVIPIRGPAPVVTGVDKPAAAPGTTIRVYGRDLNPPCAYLTPKVIFAGSGGQYFRVTVSTASATELRVVVPPGRGVVPLRVETVNGTSGNVTFTYATPGIQRISPISGDRGQLVTLSGSSFGGATAGSSYVLVGRTVVSLSRTNWTNSNITFRMPDDYGSGASGDVVLASFGCIGQVSGVRLVRLVLPGCSKLFQSIFQLVSKPGFLEKAVAVVVVTPAGRSQPVTFTYRVAATSQ